MPSPELDEYDFKLLKKCREKPLYRGRFGWPYDWNILSFGGLSCSIPFLISHGYVEFFYDWERDRPGLKITSLGLSKLLAREDEYRMPVSFTRVNG